MFRMLCSIYLNSQGYCEECLYGYDNETKQCIEQKDGCLKYINISHCIKCSENYILREGKMFRN